MEDTIDKAIIEQLQFQSLDYEYLHGPNIRRDYSEVTFKDYFLSVLRTLIQIINVTVLIN